MARSLRDAIYVKVQNEYGIIYTENHVRGMVNDIIAKNNAQVGWNFQNSVEGLHFKDRQELEATYEALTK